MEIVEILFAAEATVDAVAEFMGECADIGEFAEVGHEDNRVGVRSVVTTECTAGFARTWLGIDPVFDEEFFGFLGKSLVELIEGIDDNFFCFGPSNLLFGFEEGSVAVDVGKFVEF